MSHESGESMEPIEEVPVKELGESEMKRLVRGSKAASASCATGTGGQTDRRTDGRRAMPKSVSYEERRPAPTAYTIILQWRIVRMSFDRQAKSTGH